MKDVDVLVASALDELLPVQNLWWTATVLAPEVRRSQV